jgi:hypothetical protein
VKLLLFFTIEICWNVYPSTVTSSSLLFLSHSAILIALLKNKDEAVAKGKQKIT